eukprot:jgi/Tetstr1/422598/TSEL_013405.t1
MKKQWHAGARSAGRKAPRAQKVEALAAKLRREARAAVAGSGGPAVILEPGPPNAEDPPLSPHRGWEDTGGPVPIYVPGNGPSLPLWERMRPEEEEEGEVHDEEMQEEGEVHDEEMQEEVREEVWGEVQEEVHLRWW